LNPSSTPGVYAVLPVITGSARPPDGTLKRSLKASNRRHRVSPERVAGRQRVALMPRVAGGVPHPRASSGVRSAVTRSATSATGGRSARSLLQFPQLSFGSLGSGVGPRIWALTLAPKGRDMLGWQFDRGELNKRPSPLVSLGSFFLAVWKARERTCGLIDVPRG
jgi:hypothetical protein